MDWEDDTYYDDGNIRRNSQRKTRRIANDPSKHYPNANEAKALRRIMSRTGLNEEQVRLHPQYRKELSLAQKEGQKPKRTDAEKWCHEIIKDACKETRLAKEHPKTIEVIDRILAERKSGSWGVRHAFLLSCYNPPENAKVLLERYGITYKKIK